MKRDEIYPANSLVGCPGFTYRQAVGFKAQQERALKGERSTVEIHLEIKPIPNRDKEYYVHNTSTYVKEISSLEGISKLQVPPWAKRTADGNIEFLSIAPFYIGETQLIKSAYKNPDESAKPDEDE